jgi:hypothetical protein
MGIDDPDETNADFEIGFDLLIDLVGQVVRRDDLDCQIGREGDPAVGKLSAGKTVLSDE